MNAPVKVAVFVTALAVVFGGALLAGRQFGPVGNDSAGSKHHGTGGDQASAKHDDIPGGLMISQNGYTLRLDKSQLAAGKARQLAFTVGGPDGKPVTDYDVQHEKQLHLIAVRRDFGGFQHVHPTRDEHGTWSVPLDLTPGTWRIFADFKPSDGPAAVLGADLAVPGEVPAAPERPEKKVAQVGDYTVSVGGRLVAGEHSMLNLAVSKDGRAVTDLQPYLGAYGHLVALRAGDLAYLHVHPDGSPGDGKTAAGPDVEFGAEVLSAGRYHLFFDFQHDGAVRTAELTLDASAPADGGGPASGHDAGTHSH